MTAKIVYGREGHIARLQLNNSRRHNSLGREELEAMQEHLTRLAGDEQVRVLVLTGAGEQTFCAGASLQELGEGQMGDDLFQRTTDQLADLAIPTICAINGNVFGAGVELALSCDFRLGVEGSRMHVPAAAIGLCYPRSGIEKFVRCLGLNVSKRILVAAEEFDARGMLAIGFLDHLLLPAQLQQATSELATHIAELAPLAVRSMKKIAELTASGTATDEEVSALVTQCWESEDLQEGLAAKREKRLARFKGK